MSSRVATATAPAKLNLFLHILGRRPDGYHELQTLFQLIDLRDDVRIETTDDGRITRDPPPTSEVLAHLSGRPGPHGACRASAAGRAAREGRGRFPARACT